MSQTPPADDRQSALEDSSSAHAPRRSLLARAALIAGVLGMLDMLVALFVMLPITGYPHPRQILTVCSAPPLLLLATLLGTISFFTTRGQPRSRYEKKYAFAGLACALIGLVALPVVYLFVSKARERSFEARLETNMRAMTQAMASYASADSPYPVASAPANSTAAASPASTRSGQ